MQVLSKQLLIVWHSTHSFAATRMSKKTKKPTKSRKLEEKKLKKPNHEKKLIKPIKF
jgi:hypothetical protein